MARCVMSTIIETDEDWEPAVACMVHTHYSPCPHDGEPAATGMLHAWATPSRAEVVMFWWRRTLGQRTLVLHFDNTPEDDEPAQDHTQTTDCWCSPELLPGSPEPIARPRPGVWPL